MPRPFASRCALTLLLISLAAATVLIAQAPAGAPGREQLRARLQASLDELQTASRFPGATAGLALADGSHIGLATGVSDRDAKTPMKPSDLMLMGSVGKTFVAGVAMQLIGEKRYALTDPISRYLGDRPWFGRLPNAREVTIRHLMTHTSGLVRYEFKDQFTADLTRQPTKSWRPEELLAYILDTPAPFAPGEGWEYSDTNYIVLGMIIEKVTGKTYYDEMRKRLLQPLDLKQIVPSDSQVIPGLVQGYAGANNPFGGTDAMILNGRFVINPQFEWTGGGLACTTEDLARWAKALYEGKAFDQALLSLMLDGVPAKLGPESKYGLGVIIRPGPLGTTYGHSGFFPGYMTEMMYVPSLKTAIAVQINSSAPRASARGLARVVTDLAQIVKEFAGEPR